MRQCKVMMYGQNAGMFLETDTGFIFRYQVNYNGQAISLTLPVRAEAYTFTFFPPFFDGLLPEGVQLEAMLRLRKLDRYDFFGQLIAVGSDLVGAVTVEAFSV